MIDDTSGRLTERELDVLDKVGSAYRAFVALPQYHPSDVDEFAHHVHAIGRIVMSRAATRAHPERDWIKLPQAEG